MSGVLVREQEDRRKNIPGLKKSVFQFDILNMNYLLGNQFRHMDSQMIAQGRGPELRDSG